MNFKVSIIIPTYNIIQSDDDRKVFLKTIDSIKSQSIGFENIEVIIVDDNSNDNTKKFLNEIENSYDNLKVIYLEENSGSPSKPRSVGIKEASSDYIMFLDQDDTLTTYSCEVLFNVISNKNADVVSSNYIIKSDKEYVAFKEEEKYKEFNPRHSLKKFQKQYAPWARIFRKRILENINFPEGILLEDSFLNFKVFTEADKVIYLNDFYSLKYTVNNESITLNTNISTIEKGLQGIYAINSMLKKYPENIPLVIDDLFSMVLQTLLMFNFSIKNNIYLLKEFKKMEDIILKENDIYIYDLMKTPIWANFLNIFIKRNMFTICSILTKLIQMLLGKKSLKNIIFTKVFKHELYFEEDNNYKKYLTIENEE